MPAPPMNSGSDVVFSGSGPTRRTPTNRSLPISANSSSSSSSNSKQGTHHMSMNPPSAPETDEVELSQLPSESNEGMDSSSSGSVPQSVSFRSLTPSLSSSSSSINGGVEVDSPVRVSGIPSPSVSLLADGSNGNASTPGTHPPFAGALGPSQIPSPSVSGFSGSVPVSVDEM